MNINKKIIISLITFLILLSFLQFSITAYITATGEIDIKIFSAIKGKEEIEIPFQEENTCEFYNFTNPNLTVNSVKICSLKNISNAVLEQKKLNCSALPDPPNIQYDCVQFTITNLPTISIEYITLFFNVENSWIDSNNIDTSKILMYKFYSGSWNPLTTEKTESGNEFMSYESETDSFSYFAITGEKKAEKEEEAPSVGGGGGTVSAPAPSPAPSQPKEEEPENVTVSEPEIPKPLLDIGAKIVSEARRFHPAIYLSILSSLLLILAALLIFFYKLKKFYIST